MTGQKAGQDPGPAEGKGEPTARGNDIEQRVAHLEAWVEAAMRALCSLASIDLEALLTELDEARGADYSDWPGPAE
jgi:hypothetical protein